jgi:TDG/mug DNA glycosylase family protein
MLPLPANCKNNPTNLHNNFNRLDLYHTGSPIQDPLKTLPDLVEPGLKILFVGTNPGAKSARISHYFAGASNMFWKLLHESGLTEERLTTEFDYKVRNYGYGLTDVIKRPTHSTTELRKQDANGTRRRLDELIHDNYPKFVAFIGKAGLRYYLSNNTMPVRYGLQHFMISNSYVYLLPSTSGASFADTNYNEKLFWYTKFREDIEHEKYVLTTKLSQQYIVKNNKQRYTS